MLHYSLLRALDRDHGIVIEISRIRVDGVKQAGSAYGVEVPSSVGSVRSAIT